MLGVLTIAFLYPCKGCRAMDVQHHSHISLLLVAVDCGQFRHLDMKHKGPLVFESRGNKRKSDVDLIYKNTVIFM